MLGEEPVHGVMTVVETEIKYSGYLAQQARQIDRLKGSGGRLIPGDFDFGGVPGLSTEVRQKLEQVRPETLGQAGRIPGVTPAAIAVLEQAAAQLKSLESQAGTGAKSAEALSQGGAIAGAAILGGSVVTGVLMTKGKEVRLDENTIIRLKLERPIAIG